MKHEDYSTDIVDIQAPTAIMHRHPSDKNISITPEHKINDRAIATNIQVTNSVEHFPN